MLRLIPPIFALLVVCYVVKIYSGVANALGGTQGAGGGSPFAFSFNPFGGSPSGPKKDDSPDPEAPEVVKQLEAFRALASFARGVASPWAKAGYAGRVAPARGAALIWDVATDLPSKAHYYLPADVRAMDPAAPVTVYLVLKQERKFHSEYGKGTPFGQPGAKLGVKGYRTDSTVAVVALPERELLGTFRLEGKSPPFNIWVPAGQTEVDGEWWIALRDWVEPGVRGPGWQAKKEAAEFRKKHPPTPLGLEYLELFVEAAKAALPKAKQLANAPKTAAGKRVVWEFTGDYRHDRLGDAHSHLPAARRAAEGDTEVTVFFQTASDIKSVDGPTGPLRREYMVSVVSLPGPTPVGTYRIQGATVSRANGGVRGLPDAGEELARWVGAFGTK